MADEQGEGEHDQGDVAMPAVPASGFVVASSVLPVSKASSIAQRRPSTRASRGVPYHVEKNAILPSLSRISRPRVHIVDAERQSKKARASRSANSR